MLRTVVPFGILLILILIFTGCQGGSPTIPDGGDTGVATASGTESTRVPWGAYAVTIDAENCEATVEPVSRDAFIHFDVTDWVTPPACDDCLKVVVKGWNPQDYIAKVKVTLKNPTGMTGHDVRTVVQDYDLKEFLETGGYTELWSGGAVREPFYCFAIENPDRTFGPQETFSRDIEVHVPPGATGNATILVDASWPGNCKEPYEIETAVSSWLINDGDDKTKIVAYVYDHQGDIESVYTDLTPLGGVVTPMFDDGNQGDGDAYDGIFAVKGITTTVPFGEYDVWVSCKSMGSKHITYQKAHVIVSDIDPYRHDPDYDRVYDNTQVKQFNVFISPENWAAMKQHLEEQLQLPWDQQDLQYFECVVGFEGHIWKHVGIRNKGNSSLNSCFNQGVEKLPFRFDFDEYEDEFPETNNQRFWGLNWMVFNNGFKDPSMLREIITYELFRGFGAVASHSAHYRLFIDFGEGLTYFGLYTTVEVVDKRFVEDRFGDDSGNLYKPDGPGADLTHFEQKAFEKKTNEDEADWSDVIHFINVLNASYGSPAQFKTAIEQVFVVESFINWLVINSVLCNLDSYAAMSHNYYLYNNPGDGLFYFMPWDCNESFGAFYGSLNADTMPTWDILNPVDGPGYKPLIERILWVPEYMDAYKLKVRALLDGPLQESAIHFRIDVLHNIARPYVIGPDGEFPPYTLLHHQEEFDVNVDSDVPPFGPHRILGLKSFLADRRAYIDTVIP